MIHPVLITDEIVDEEVEISEDIDEVSVDIPAPVVEDDDIELLDELDTNLVIFLRLDRHIV